MTSASLEDLVAEGMALDVEAYWGAGFLADRYLPGEVSWQWPDVVRAHLTHASRLLDMGTGEGSALLGLRPLPRLTVAYEAWWSTVPAAVATLRPAGVHLVVCQGSDENTAAVRTQPALPFADASFDVVTNRHEAFDPADVLRLLRPGGVFVTQQVGSDESEVVRALLGLTPQGPAWDLEVACAQLASAGLTVETSGEERATSRFTDVAAFIGYVRSTPWGVPEFDAVAMGSQLAALHERCLRDGSIAAVGHRFWLAARAR